MDLTLRQAATRLGKSVRQVRYLIQQGKLPAYQDGSRWMLREEDLPVSEGQSDAVSRKSDRLRDAVEASLGEPARSSSLPRPRSARTTTRLASFALF